MAVLTWVTRADPAGRNDFSGRWMNMSNADSAAAIANGWGSATPLEWKATDAAVIAARDAASDNGAAANWYEKMQDPKYSVALDDLGSYTPPTGGAFTNITLSTPTVDDAATANTVVGTLTAVGGNTPVTFSLPGGTTLWNINGAQLRKTSSTAGLYTVGTMNVNVKATGSDGESYTKSIAITVT